MKELVECAKERMNQCNWSLEFWKKIAFYVGVTYFFTFQFSPFIFPPVCSLHELKTSCENETDLTTDCDNTTIASSNFFSRSNTYNGFPRSNVTCIHKDYYPLTLIFFQLPNLIIIMEYFNLCGEAIPGIFAVAIDKNFVAFGPNPSKRARWCLMLSLLSHLTHSIYVLTFYRDSLPTYRLIFTFSRDFFGLICDIIVRYACSMLYIICLEQSKEHERTELEAGRKPIYSANYTRRWNWYEKGKVFIKIFFFILNFLLVFRLLWINIYSYAKMEDRISTSAVIRIAVIFISNRARWAKGIVTIWRDRISLSQCIIYKKLFVAFGPNPSKSARYFLLINVLFSVLNSLLMVWFWFSMSSGHRIGLVFANILFMPVNITIRHSFSTFYNFTSHKKKFKEVKNIRLRKVREEAAIAVKKAIIE